LALRRAVGVVRSKREVRRAVRQARDACRANPATVRVSWDLDNTLASSGVLLRTGVPLQEAIVDAQPLANMPAFYEALHARLPEAHHFILSARMPSMRRDTIAWLARHGLEADDAAICFVPNVDAKLEVWRQLARGARLVVVDDLSYDHEAIEPSVYEHLVEVAKQIAFIYIGLDRIAEITQSAAASEAVAAEVVGALAS
jgi:hypothetical protein